MAFDVKYWIGVVSADREKIAVTDDVCARIDAQDFPLIETAMMQETP